MFRYRLIFRTTILLSFIMTYTASAFAQRAGKGGDETKPEKIVYKTGNAWKLDFPLGFHIPAPIDTLLYNYQAQSIPSLNSLAYATTGNLGAEGQTQIYFNRKPYSQFFFEDALNAWLPLDSEQKFYNVYVPMTLLSYNTGGNKYSSQERLRATFAGNVNRKIGIGAHADYLYSKGSYENQAAKDFTFGFSGYYTGNRYEMQAFYNHYNLLNKENGGITDPLYITDPAVLQGGVSKIEPKSIPTNLTTALSRIIGQQLFMTHAFKIGYWKEEQVNDTLKRDIYIPMLKFIYSLDYKYGHHIFSNKNVTEAKKFWKNTYLDPKGTSDETYYTNLTNTFGISMVEGFRKWAKFGLSAFITHEYRHFRQMPYDETAADDPDDNGGNGDQPSESQLTPLPIGFTYQRKTTQNSLWVGGELTKQRGEALTFIVGAKFGLIGANTGDIDIEGAVHSRLRLFGDTVEIAAKGVFRNTEQPYLLQHYLSNHFAWSNNFGKTRTFRIGGEILIPWTKTRISAGMENVQNMVYFNPEGLPVQHGGSVQIVTASIEQKLRFGIWNWNNSVTWQTSSQSEVLSLPTIALYSNMFLNFTAFRVLNLQIGVDCNFYTKYFSPNYQPATMSFVNQREEKVGGYPFCNAYITAKLYKVRFYLLMSHVNQGIGAPNYFSMPLYPLNPRKFQFGLSIDFAN